MFTKNNPEVIQLSQTLNSLPIYSEEERKLDFRNPSGVAMKLCNFMAIDPTNENKGLTSYSRLDESTFHEFQDKRDELKKIFTLILNSLKDKKTINNLYKIEDETDNLVKEVFEGEIIYKLHKLRERDSKLTESKKKLVLKNTGKLECEVCDFDFYEKYGDLGKGFIECHHIKQLSTYISNQKTLVEDLALVCSNCHRMLHRNIEDMSIKNLKNTIKIAGNK